MRSICLTLAILGIVVVPAMGQANPDSVHRRNECRRAIQIVSTGRPAPHRQWAHDFIRVCGTEGGKAVAEQLRSTRRISDRQQLEQVTRPTQFLIDGNIFEAAVEVAEDRSASDVARIFALRALVNIALPNAMPSYEEMTGRGAIGAGCMGGYGIHDLTHAGAPLPAGAYQRSFSLAGAILADTNETEDVRAAARCVTWLAGKRLPNGGR